MRTKILYLIDKLRPAGAQKHLMELLFGIDKERFETKLVTLEELGIKKIYGLSGLKGLIRLVKLMKKEGFDIVHTYLFSENILGVIAGKIAGLKTIITSRRDTGMLREGKLRHILAYRLTNRWVDKIVCVSEAVKRVVLSKEKVNREKIKVIYNGVDLEKFNVQGLNFGIKEQLKINTNDFVVGMIANFSWIKGHRDLIQAIPLILEEVPNTTFLLIGDGYLRKELEIEVKNTSYKDKVLFLGSRNDIPQLLSLMDISVNASYSEGMSNTILESMASGVPVVATAVDGNLETVMDKETGFLIPPKTPKALAEAIIRLLKNKDLREKLGENARRIAKEKFSLERMVREFEDLYLSFTQPKIAFICSQFPQIYETFILREFVGLRESGLKFKIISLKFCKDIIIHPQAKDFLTDTFHPKISLLSIFRWICGHPCNTIKAIMYVFYTYGWAGVELIKAMYVLGECFYIADLIKKYRIYHLHTHWATMPTTAGVILNVLTGVPFSFTAHAWDIFVSQRGLKDKIIRARFCVTCTEYNRRFLGKLIGNGRGENNDKYILDKIILNYHGIELDKFPLRNKIMGNGRINILSIGRLVDTKGFDYLIDACQILDRERLNFYCKIVGQGELLGRLNRKVKEYNLSDKIEFLGEKTQKEIMGLYREATVLVQPSVIAKNGDRDGIPNVILEAMACGVPVISTNISGIPEVIIDKETGILVPPNNSIALAKAILNLANDEALKEKIIYNARILVEKKFDAKRNVENLVGIFKKFISYLDFGVKQSVCYRRINILYIIWSLGLGGAESVVINLVKGLDKGRFNPFVCCLNDKGIFAEELEREEIKVIALNKKPGLDFSIIPKMIRLINTHNIDIVHTHLWGANCWGRVAAVLGRVKIIIATEHSVDVWKPKHYFLIDRFLSRFTHKIVVVSEAVKDFYKSKGIAEEKLEVIYNGINEENFRISGEIREKIRKELGVNDNTKVLGIIGRLVEPKGHKFLFNAMGMLDGKYNLKVVVVGEGVEKETLKEMVRSLGLEDKVIFTGFRNDVNNILQSIDILVIPSLREGLPLVMLEAMASGVPVISSKVGGIPEVIINGKNGILIEPANVRELAEAISVLVSNNELYQYLSHQAKQSIKAKFTLDRMIKDIEELYLKLL
ncbi:MAG: glycosyltransferase [Candidatus Omnitrophica bacterium]|nr:glycosyltransferase [Candidatus Omnitrophota bacterium]